MTIRVSDGRTAETGVVSSCKMVGVNAFLGNKITQAAYIVQISEDALEIDANILIDKFNSNEQMRHILLH